MAQDCYINPDLLDEISAKYTMTWNSFLTEKFRSAIAKYNDLLILGLDKLSWKHLKAIIKNDICLNNFVNITNMCINLGYWPLHFKMLSFIIISKSDQTFYNSPKMFWPTILLNMLGKLLEKVTSERLQFQAISKNFIYSCQLNGLK